jgi:hypothetical protein
MQLSRIGVQTSIAALVLAGGLVAAGAARADTLFLEAEGNGHFGQPLSDESARITSPFLIKDDPAASEGRYLTVAAGFNSQSAPPAAEGVATYRFSVAEAGTYLMWGRVIAPSPNDDSFWVRLRKVGAATSTLVRWNDIPVGTTWHWARVINDGTTTPSQFTLEAFAEYELQVSYREDGAKLDVLAITSDTAFNPQAPPTTAPENPGAAIPAMLTAGSKTGIRVMWSEVPGAKSYTVNQVVDVPAPTPEDPDRTEAGTVPLKTGITGHVFTDTALPPEGFCKAYDVVAVFPDGTFRQRHLDTAPCQEARFNHHFVDVFNLSASPPMVVSDDNSAFSSAGTPESLNAPPAHGRVRMDFTVGGTAKIHIWFMTSVFDKNHDSFWARMDDGAWIKWNNIPDFCGRVSNSDAGGAPVTFNLAGGTHRFELATRETGVINGSFVSPQLGATYFLTDDLNATSSICDD